MPKIFRLLWQPNLKMMKLPQSCGNPLKKSLGCHTTCGTVTKKADGCQKSSTNISLGIGKQASDDSQPLGGFFV